MEIADTPLTASAPRVAAPQRPERDQLETLLDKPVADMGTGDMQQISSLLARKPGLLSDDPTIVFGSEWLQLSEIGSQPPDHLVRNLSINRRLVAQGRFDIEAQHYAEDTGATRVTLTDELERLVAPGAARDGQAMRQMALLMRTPHAVRPNVPMYDIDDAIRRELDCDVVNGVSTCTRGTHMFPTRLLRMGLAAGRAADEPGVTRDVLQQRLDSLLAITPDVNDQQHYEQVASLLMTPHTIRPIATDVVDGMGNSHFVDWLATRRADSTKDDRHEQVQTYYRGLQHANWMRTPQGKARLASEVNAGGPLARDVERQLLAKGPGAFRRLGIDVPTLLRTELRAFAPSNGAMTRLVQPSSFRDTIRGVHALLSYVEPTSEGERQLIDGSRALWQLTLDRIDGKTPGYQNVPDFAQVGQAYASAMAALAMHDAAPSHHDAVAW